MIKARRLAPALVVACLASGVAAAPSMAASQSAKAKSSAAAVTAKSVNRKVNALTKSNTKTDKSLAKSLAALSLLAKSADGKTSTLLAAAPQLIDALTKLGDAVQKQIAPGLKTLATAVQDQIAPGLKALSAAVQDQIVPNLTKLGDAYQAVEYGLAGLTATGVGGVQAGNNIVSSDIPDDGNPAVVHGTAIVASGAAGGIDLRLRGLIRSNEGDNAASDTTGQAGGFMTVKQVDPAAAAPGVLGDCFDDNLATTGPQNIFVLGTPTGASILTPSGPVTNLNLVNIPGGVARTSTANVASTDTALAPIDCHITAGGAGEIYEVTYQVSFLDIPTSTTPGPKD